MSHLPKEVTDRFWPKVEKIEGGCWAWRAQLDYDGYGKFQSGRAHRVSWLIHNGPIPDNKAVIQTCGNRTCVRPEHLELIQGKAKLTEEQVKEIRSLKRPVNARELAKKYGVTKATISHVLNNKRWQHVEGSP